MFRRLKSAVAMVAVGLSSTTAVAQDGGADGSFAGGSADASTGADHDGAPPAADSGPAACNASGQCAPPQPYCHPAAQRCVECLSDTNCGGSTGACDTDTGTCVECASDRHCSAPYPYCDRAADTCVECLTNENCGSSGVECVDGVCGSCGDGVCVPRETISEYDFGEVFFPGGGPQLDESGKVHCPEDCVSECPETDLGSALGDAVATGTNDGASDRLFAPCGGEFAAEVTFGWTAPHDGSFVFDTRGSSFVALLYTLGSSCTASVDYCSYEAAEGQAELMLSMTRGQSVILVIDSWGETGDYVLNVHDAADYSGGGECDVLACPEREEGPRCCGFGSCGFSMPYGCEPAPPGGGPGGPPGFPLADAGPVDPVVRDRCLTNALGGDGAVCVEVAECVCATCPQQLEDCRLIPGCRDLLDCMVEERCSGVECDAPDRCASAISGAGGLSGPAFRAASALQTCASFVECSLDCPEASDAGSGDGGVCKPSEESACACGDGGVDGVRICKADGSGYGRCVCIDAPDGGSDSPETKDDGCGCRAAGGGGSNAPAALAALALALSTVRRRRSLFRTDR